MVWIIALILQLLAGHASRADAAHVLVAAPLPKAPALVKCPPPSGQPPVGVPAPIDTPVPVPTIPPGTVPPLCS